MFWKNQIVIQLKRIADALEKQIDLSTEDIAVRKMIGDVKRAEQNIPPRTEPKKGTN